MIVPVRTRLTGLGQDSTYNPFDQLGDSGAGYSANPSTSSGSSWLNSAAMNSLLQGGLQIGKILAAQQTPAGQQLVYNAQGQLVSASTQTAGYPLGTTAVSATGNISGTTIMLLVAGLFAVMLLKGQGN